MGTVRLWLSDDRPGERERERERLSVRLQPTVAKPGKPDKYNVAADLTYTSSDQMSGYDNTR